MKAQALFFSNLKPIHLQVYQQTMISLPTKP